jgi:hypothetical protein
MIDLRYPSYGLVLQLLNAALFELSQGEISEATGTIEQARTLLKNLGVDA